MFNRMTNPKSTERGNLVIFGERLKEHFRRRYVLYAVVAAVALVFQHCFRLGVNATESLPHTLYLIHKGEPIHRGDFIAFRWHGGGPYPVGVTFIKVAAGVPGDTVSRIDRAYYVNGIYVGSAKTRARNGQPLALMATGVLGADEYYVSAPHPDSLDSRYRLTGWISSSDFLGRAYALF
jgi:conjugal transfer pilin signal peptidase TrbI